MQYKIVFEKKVNLNTIMFVPAKAVRKQGTEELTEEWIQLLKLLVPRKKVEVTYEWDSQE